MALSGTGQQLIDGFFSKRLAAPTFPLNVTWEMLLNEANRFINHLRSLGVNPSDLTDAEIEQLYTVYFQHHGFTG